MARSAGLPAALQLLLCAAAAAQDVLLLNVGCSGVVDVFPGLPYGMTADLSNQRRVADRAAGELKERLRCHCPQLSDAQFMDRFNPFRVLMNLLSGEREHVEDIPCLDEEATYTRDMEKFIAGYLGGSHFTVPATCTRESFVNGDGCLLELDTAPHLTANLKVALSECDGGYLPGMAVWCSGEGCETLFKPCTADSCAEGQECVAGLDGFTHLLPNATFYAKNYFGFDVSGAMDHLRRALDGDLMSDRSLEDCAAPMAALPEKIMKVFSNMLGAGAATGVCVPEGFKGFQGMMEDYYSRFDRLSVRRRDECAPLRPRKDSTYSWRRGQITDNGQSGGGWCDSYNDCAFHDRAGDCESDDDFEYYMGSLYCRYKRKDGCQEFQPFCYWDPNHSTGDKAADKKRKQKGYHCVFNQSTQLDGLDADADWLRGKDCADPALAEACAAVADPSVTCEMGFCKCQNGEWDMEDRTCTLPTKKKDKIKCSTATACYGELLQCYEKTSQDSPFMQTASACEKYMQCRCKGIADQYKCDARKMCGRRCACQFNEHDRFVGPHCDIRLMRGDMATMVTYNDEDEPLMLPWDGMVSARGMNRAADIVRKTPVPTGLAAKPVSSSAEALLVTSCDGKVWLYPGSPFGFGVHFRAGADFAGALAEAGVESLRCLFDGVSDRRDVAMEQLAEAYLPWLPRMWVCRFFECAEGGAVDVDARIAEVKAAKAKAVEDEDYEAAGRLKKELKSLEAQKDAPGGAREAFHPAGSLADLWFNVSGTSFPDDMALADIVTQLQAEWDVLGHTFGMEQGGGWVPYVAYALSDVLGRAKGGFFRTIRWLGWGTESEWMDYVYQQEGNPDQNQRTENVRYFLEARREQLHNGTHNATFGALLERKAWLWDGKIALPKAAAPTPTMLSFRAPVPSHPQSELLVHYATCPDAPSVPEVQIGVSGPLGDAMVGRTHCKKAAAGAKKKPSAKAQCPALADCVAPETTFLGFKMAEFDVTTGFLWGGNFTKGFMGQCPILSTTVNQKDFSTVAPKCLEPAQYVQTVRDIMQDALGLATPKKADPAFCFVDLQTVLQDVFAQDGAKVTVAGAQPMGGKPFAPANAGGAAHDEL